MSSNKTPPIDPGVDFTSKKGRSYQSRDGVRQALGAGGRQGHLCSALARWTLLSLQPTTNLSLGRAVLCWRRQEIGAGREWGRMHQAPDTCSLARTPPSRGTVVVGGHCRVSRELFQRLGDEQSKMVSRGRLDGAMGSGGSEWVGSMHGSMLTDALCVLLPWRPRCYGPVTWST